MLRRVWYSIHHDKNDLDEIIGDRGVLWYRWRCGLWLLLADDDSVRDVRFAV